MCIWPYQLILITNSIISSIGQWSTTFFHPPSEGPDGLWIHGFMDIESIIHYPSGTSGYRKERKIPSTIQAQKAYVIFSNICIEEMHFQGESWPVVGKTSWLALVVRKLEQVAQVWLIQIPDHYDSLYAKILKFPINWLREVKKHPLTRVKVQIELEELITACPKSTKR